MKRNICHHKWILGNQIERKAEHSKWASEMYQVQIHLFHTELPILLSIEDFKYILLFIHCIEMEKELACLCPLKLHESIPSIYLRLQHDWTQYMHINKPLHIRFRTHQKHICGMVLFYWHNVEVCVERMDLNVSILRWLTFICSGEKCQSSKRIIVSLAPTFISFHNNCFHNHFFFFSFSGFYLLSLLLIASIWLTRFTTPPIK